MLKLSRFNEYMEKGNGELIIYNTFTSGVLKVEKTYTEMLKKFIENRQEHTKMNNELLEHLKKGGMILDEDINEIDNLEYLRNIKRYDSNELSLTIATTSACNFRCPYCYEEGIQHLSMDKKTQEKLLAFVDKYNSKVLNVTWYGGEPLLNLECIYELSSKFLEKFGEKYHAGIVTNGYYLTREVAIKLRENHVQHAQITLDGIKSSHDKRRIPEDGSGTFDIIINNIKNTCDLLRISIRMNVDKTNHDQVEKLITFLKEENLFDKIHFYVAPVDDINSTEKNCNCYSIKEFSLIEKEMIDFSGEIMHPPVAYLGLCGAVSNSSFVIAPNGDLYKCWNEIGRTEYKVGDLDNGVTLNSRLLKWMTHNPLNSTNECMECLYLPVCYGGCPYQAITTNKVRCITSRYNGFTIINQLDNLKKGGDQNDVAK